MATKKTTVRGSEGRGAAGRGAPKAGGKVGGGKVGGGKAGGGKAGGGKVGGGAGGKGPRKRPIEDEETRPPASRRTGPARSSGDRERGDREASDRSSPRSRAGAERTERAGAARGAAGRGTAAAGRAGRSPMARTSKPGPRIKSSHDAPSRAGTGARAGTGTRAPAGGATRRPRPAPSVEDFDREERRPRAGGDPRRGPIRASTSEIARSAQPARAVTEARGEARLAKTGPASRRAPGRSVPPAQPSGAARELALMIASAGLDKKAQHVEVLDVSGRVDYTDFLVVMTGTSDRHVHSIAQGIEEELSRKKVKPISVEGLSQATWVLLDYGDVVCHVFQEETRSVYDIEGLWLDARKVQLPATLGGDAGPPSAR